MSGVLKSGELEIQLESFIENMRQLAIMVVDFQPSAQSTLVQKIQKIVADLKNLNKMKEELNDVKVPMEVMFDYIDKGINPNLYTQEVMCQTLSKNEDVKGKIEGFKKLKADMMIKLSKEFPNEMAAYRAMRERKDDE